MPRSSLRSALGVLLLCLVAFPAAGASTVQLTTYRISPRNYTGLSNLNSGNGAGDAFFGLYELSIPELCSDPRMARLPQCSNIPILSIPGFNVYTQYTIEADSRFGEYNECNPDPRTGIFSCRPGDGHSRCWYSDPVLAKEFADVCSNQQCDCDAVSKLSVGAEKLPFHSSGGAPPNWPAVCSATFTPLAGTALNASGSIPSKTVTVTDEGACCTACKQETGFFKACRGYTFFKETGTCLLFHSPKHTAKTTGANSGYMSGGQKNPSIFEAAGKLADVLNDINATWYSTQEVSQCKPGQVIGKDCWWRITETLRTVNASCVNNAMVANVKAQHPSCWSACPDQDDTKSDCWINCLFEVLDGNSTANISPMEGSSIVAPFYKAFTDPTSGGCPTVPACPPPCNPPGSQ